ncbi:MAG TPA: WD40 repeat domain-containing protein [Verrucomicrobiales bacterium]|nr:WD40 repeat domain-containing protein [Verrucomicrobiales bacterium]
MPDPKQAKVTKDLPHDAPLITCLFDPKGRWLFACAEDRSVVRWEVESGKKTVLSAHDSWPMALACTPDASTLISGAGDDTLIWWPANDPEPKPIRKVKAHAGWIRAVVISPDGTLVASGGNDRIIRLWRTADGSPVGEMKGHESDIYTLLFHPSGKFLLSGDLAGKVMQWEVPGGKSVRTFDAGKLHTYDGGQQVHYGGVRGLTLSADGKWLAAAGHHKSSNPLGNVQEPLVLRFAWEDAKPAGQHLGTDDLKNHTLWGAQFHKDGYLIAAAGGGGGFLLFWNNGEEKPFHRFTLPNSARGMHLHPNGTSVATAHHDRRARITAF